MCPPKPPFLSFYFPFIMPFFFFSQKQPFFFPICAGASPSHVRQGRPAGIWLPGVRRCWGGGNAPPGLTFAPYPFPKFGGGFGFGGGGVVGLQEAVFALPPPPYFSLQWGEAGGEGGAWGHPCKQVPHGGRYRGPRTLPRAPLHLPA